jgi:hypothetical protein
MLTVESSKFTAWQVHYINIVGTGYVHQVITVIISAIIYLWKKNQS